MNQLKVLVKDVLHKIQDDYDHLRGDSFPTIRMSEIASQSSLSAYTSRSVSEQSFSNGNDTINVDTQNNNEFTQLTSENNNEKKLETHQTNKIVSSEIDGLTKIPTIVEGAKKIQIDDKGSHDSVFSFPNRSPLLPKAGKTNKPKIFMGKRALLRVKSADLQENPSVVVHELVNDKYQDKITHCIGRMYERRLSRESRNTDEDGTSSNYSQGSLSTIGTPDSLYDGKSYFSLFYPPRSECEFDFLKSTDDLNKDTTAEAFMNSTVNSVGSKNASTDLDYDPQKFLKNALGDMSFESQSLNMSFPNTMLQSSQSMDTVNVSSLLSKAGSVYSSVRKSIRRACSFKDKNSDGASKNRYRGKDRCQSFSPDCFGPAENLMQELYVQNGIIFQVSKALTYCRNTKDVTSPEYIEAEKILLVASCHKEALQNALDAAEFGEKEKCCQKYSGSLQIRNIVYYLKGDVCTEEESQNNYIEHFVVVVTSGKTVLASKVLTADKNGEIKVEKSFDLTGLTTDFQISVAIYALKIKHLEKKQFHLKTLKKDKKLPCPSPKSFFHLNHRSSHRNLQVDNVLSIKPSSFTLWGTCTIKCSDMERTHFRMHHVPLCSSLEGYFTAVLGSNVTLTNRANGFLTIGIEDKSHLVWNRRWCILEGSLLKYWNYPSEEFSSDPVGSIDLSYATEKVSPADRSICPRPKSLCLLIKSKDVTLKYFLSADSSEEKQSWQEEINFVIGTLGAWNCLKSKTDS